MTARIIPFVKPRTLKKYSFCGETAKTIHNDKTGKSICYKCVAIAAKRAGEE